MSRHGPARTQGIMFPYIRLEATASRLLVLIELQQGVSKQAVVLDFGIIAKVVCASFQSLCHVTGVVNPTLVDFLLA